MEKIIELVRIKQIIVEQDRDRYIVRSPEDCADYVKEQ